MNAAPRNTILQGDVLEHLRELPDGCVQTVVTSPPYWGLRDYGVAGQIGLEPTPAAYVARMVDVFREVKRVLRDDGTCWVNLGDSYANDEKWGGRTGGKHARGLHGEPVGRSRVRTGLKPKDLVGIPWRMAFALRDDGWYLRSDIVWSKPNPMPESVSDRPTRAHEYIFLLSKRARYYYDAAAVREPAKESDAPSRWKTPDGWDTSAGAGGHGSIHRAGREKGHRTDKQRGHWRRHDGFNDRWDGMSKEEQQVMGANKRDVWTVASAPFSDWAETVRRVRVPLHAVGDGTKRIASADCPVHVGQSVQAATAQCGQRASGESSHSECNDDCHVQAQPTVRAPIDQNHGADSADESSDLPHQTHASAARSHSSRSRKTGRVPATSPAYTASAEIGDHTHGTSASPGLADSVGHSDVSSSERGDSGDHPSAQTVNHNADTFSSALPPVCTCEYYDEIAEKTSHFATFPPKLIEPCILAGSRPGDLVLDPFGGSGTTALVAQQWQRDWLLIELNPAYVELAQRRLATVPVRLFADGRGA